MSDEKKEKPKEDKWGKLAEDIKRIRKHLAEAQAQEAKWEKEAKKK